MITHTPYENDDNEIELCLECGIEIPADQLYCDKCYNQLEAEGFFEIPEPFEAEDFQ